MSPRTLILALLVPATTAPALGQKVDLWKGERVMLRTDDVRPGVVRAGHLVRTAPPLDANAWYTVRGESHGLLELENGAGWVASADVVRMGDARAYFGRRIADEPGVARWWGRRGLASSRRVQIRIEAGGIRRLDGDGANPHEDFAEAVRLEPTSPIWRIELAKAYMTAGGWDQATEQLDAAVRLDATSSYAFTTRGLLRYLQGKLELAVADYDRAIGLAPAAAWLYVDRASCLARAREWPRALSDMERAVRLAPRNEEVLETVSQLLWQFNSVVFNTDGAAQFTGKSFGGGEPTSQTVVRLLDRWLEVNPVNTDALLARALVLGHVGQYERALDDIRLAQAVAPVDPTPYRAEGHVRATAVDARFRDGQRALELARVATRLAGDAAGYRECQLFAAAYAELGQFDRAVAVQQRVVDLFRAGVGDADDEVRTEAELRLMCYRRKEPFRD